MTGPSLIVKRIALLTALLFGLTLLSACETAEERAEKYYQAGLELLEAGDVDRALIEFRNVFKLNPLHKDARLAYARAEQGRGNEAEAYSQYLRLVEQYPENLEGLRALTLLARKSGNWAEVERHGAAAAKLAPDDIQLQSITNSLAYYYAIRDRDTDARNAAVKTAADLIASDPTLLSGWQVTIDDLIRRGDWTGALKEIDAALKVIPAANNGLYLMRLGVLQELGDPSAIEAQLKAMIERFPEDKNIKQSLVQLYVSLRDFDAAENFLRSRIDIAAEDTAPVERLIGFLETFRSRDQAIAELDTLIAQGGPNRNVFRSVRAQLNFDAGDSSAAIAEIRSILEGAERTQATRQIEVELARMLFQTGNAVGARALIETVLEEDRTQIAAIKLKAGWLIEDDKTGDAIVLLREALGQSPRDPDLMTLMARAHERDGSRVLVGEMLALAVESSNRAPTESLRYANFLVREEDNLILAESVLIDALRLDPQNTALLSALGNLYLGMEDWARLDGVVVALENLSDPETQATAKELTARKLAIQNRGEELTAFLENLASDPQLGASAEIVLIRSLLAKNDTAAALERLDVLLAEAPDSLGLRYVKAFALTMAGKPDEAEGIYRALLAQTPRAERIWMRLYQLDLARGNPAGATATLNEALAALPESRNLLWARAGELQRDNDIDGAIAVYEDLYARNSGSLIIANNLASLLADYREGTESLERAYVIAKRLRGTEIPAFQDTYGWIAYRMGDLDAALNHLEPAGAGLPNDPAVQYHLAKTYLALGRDIEALETFRKSAAAAAGAAVTPAFMVEVEVEIERLSAAARASETPESKKTQ